MKTVEGEHRGKDRRPAEYYLWTTGVLFSVALHAGGALWLLRDPPMVAADNSPPAAIMIELAAEPEAVMTETNEISPDQDTSDYSPEQVDQPVETVTPQEVVEPELTDESPLEEPLAEKAEMEPVETATPQPEIDPLEEQIVSELEYAEVPIPVTRPKPPEKRETAEKQEPAKEQVKKPQRQKASVASQSSIEARAQVKQSDRNAAQETSSGLFSSSMTPAKWQSRLMAHLERRKKYPNGARRRGEVGIAYVRFRIDDAGNVLSASLARSSGFPELDQEVLAMVHRASPVPAPPPDVNKTVTAPVRFSVE